ncbi:MAG: hypothetical protein L3K10_04480 [Thermoplasmata archaeon]|nr:hypothetical protein [Thermoplasmata archaeon]
MSDKQYRKRIEKKVGAKSRTISLDVQRGMLWAGTELVKNSKTVGHDVKRVGAIVGRTVGRGGKRIGSATRQRIARATSRIKSRRRAQLKRA